MCRGQYAQIASMLIKTANFDTGGYAVGVIIVGTRDELGRAVVPPESWKKAI